MFFLLQDQHCHPNSLPHWKIPSLLHVGPVLRIVNLRALFGDRRAPFWDENDVMLLAAKANGASLPYIFLTTGSQDGIRRSSDKRMTLPASFDRGERH